MRAILVVEDNQTNMSFFVDVLESAGHQVWQAEDAVAGLRLARDAHPDIIFMDIQLHGMDGLEATRQLKADHITRPIPVCALTAFAMKGDEERIRFGDGYLAKPVSYILHRHKLDSFRAELACLPQAGRSMNGLIL